MNPFVEEVIDAGTAMIPRGSRS